MSRTFRLFVSSTFDDFALERNALQGTVFPRLAALCEGHGDDFTPIDLRWGVAEEAARNHRTMEICLDEVDRCREVTPRPNFLVLLGRRYGWRPIPSLVPAEEFEGLLAAVTEEEHQLLLDHPSAVEGVDGWYRLDVNAVPPSYSLRARPASVDAGRWTQVEDRLRNAFARAMIIGQWPADDPRRHKYETSATHQEILRGALAPGMARNAVCVFREFDDRLLGAHANHTSSVPPADRAPGALPAELAALLAALRQRHHDSCLTYRDTSSFSVTAYIDALCRDVYDNLSVMVAEEVDRQSVIDPLEAEVAIHRAHSAAARRVFAGREDVIERILQAARHERRITVLFGGPGSGRTALLSIVSADLRQEDNALLIERYVGATAESTNGDALAGSIAAELSATAALAPSGDAASGSLKLRAVLGALPKMSRTYVVVDGFDVVADRLASTRLFFAIANAPEHVRWVVSCGAGQAGDVFRAAEATGQAQFVDADSLTAHDIRVIVDARLASVRRTLQPAQRAALLATRQTSTGALTLRCGVASRWTSWDAPDTDVLEGTPVDLLRREFLRLSRPDQHGATLVDRVIGSIAVAEYGITEAELVAVIDADPDTLSEFRARSPHSPSSTRLPTVVWARLLHDLRQYLREEARGGKSMLALASTTVEAAVASLMTDADRRLRHLGLSRCFDEAWASTSLPEGTARDRVSASLMWHLIHGESWDSLARLLEDPAFFATAWRAYRRLVRPAWYSLEKHSTHRLAAAFSAQPTRRDEVVPFAAAAMCLADSGKIADARACFARLLDACRSFGAAEMALVMAAQATAFGVAKRDLSATEAATRALIELCASLQPSALPAFEREIERLSAALGDHHVRYLLTRVPSSGGPVDSRSVRSLAEAERLLALDDTNGALKAAKQALFSAIDDDDPTEAADAEGFIGKLYLLVGWHDKAIESLQEARNHYLELGNDDGLIAALGHLAQAQVGGGRLSDARKSAEELAGVARLTGSPHAQALAAFCLARGWLDTDPIAALRHAREADGLAAMAADNDQSRLARQTLAESRERCKALKATPNDPLSRLPVAECARKGCNGAGRFIRDRVIWVGPPSSNFVLWCSACRSNVCSACSLLRHASREQLEALPADNHVRRLAESTGLLPATPICPDCSAPMGEGGAEVVVQIK